MSDDKKLPHYEYNKVPLTEKIQVSEKIDNPPKYGYGVRHIQLAIFLLCLTVNIIGRGHMGVTIVAMTTNPELSIATENTSIYLETFRNFSNQAYTNLTEKEFEYLSISNRTIENVTNSGSLKHTTWSWSKSIQEMILNAFFLGYMIMMFPMGMICQRYGGKLPLQIGLLVNGIICLLAPWLTIWGDWKAACCCRVLQGLSQAGTYPSIQNLLAKWVPEDERATLSACVHTGLNLGTVIAFQLAGFLAASPWGWPSTFYAVGVICLSCFLVLTVFGAATPEEHKSISLEEKNYIMRAANKGNGKKLKVPWRAIFTSKPLWGTMITHIGANITFVFFFNQVPTYIHYILDIDVRNSGLLSSLPYLASVFTVLLFGWMADYGVNNNIVTKNNSRRISNSIASCGMALCLLLTSYTTNPTIAVTWLVVAMAANMGLNTGWMVNYIDLAPNFAGSLLAIGNTLGNIFIVLTPIIVSYVVTDMTNVTQWRIMFYITAGVSVVSNAIFLILMSTDVQLFNYADVNESCVEDIQEEITEKKKNVDAL